MVYSRVYASRVLCEACVCSHRTRKALQIFFDGPIDNEAVVQRVVAVPLRDYTLTS